MGTLYLVSTPIGNMGDITVRALETLWMVDLILCEDTRETQHLLNYYKSQTDRPYPKLLSYHDYNRDQRIPYVLELLKEGKNIALVTDRGTPLLSDPGYKLVKAVLQEKEQGVEVTLDSIPGASAILPALQLSGFPMDRFLFIGFLPKSEAKIRSIMKELPRMTIVFYESPQRLKETLKIIKSVLGKVDMAVCVELTKMYQDIIRGSVDLVKEKFEDSEVKGEITVVLNLKVQD